VIVRARHGGRESFSGKRAVEEEREEGGLWGRGVLHLFFYSSVYFYLSILSPTNLCISFSVSLSVSRLSAFLCGVFASLHLSRRGNRQMHGRKAKRGDDRLWLCPRVSVRSHLQRPSLSGPIVGSFVLSLSVCLSVRISLSLPAPSFLMDSTSLSPSWGDLCVGGGDLRVCGMSEWRVEGSASRGNLVCSSPAYVLCLSLGVFFFFLSPFFLPSFFSPSRFPKSL